MNPSETNPVYIVEAQRTPIGRFQGSLSEMRAPELGAVAIRSVLPDTGGEPLEIDLVCMGNVLTSGVGQAPARQSALLAGLPNRVPCTTLGKVCGSGLEAVIQGAQNIQLGSAGLVVAGGQESMSLSPYLLMNARAGFRMGHQSSLDSMIADGLWDPYGDQHMGNCAEQCARKFGFSRAAQDEFAISSYTKAQQAWTSKAFDGEVTLVSARQGRNSVEVLKDEEPFAARFEKMPQLRPAFEKEGTITAANASKINDGASALLLASEASCAASGLQPKARIVAYARHAQEPEWFTTAPIGAMKTALALARLQLSDIDLFEINEAFAVVPMAAIDVMSIDSTKVNVKGGAIALGHPIGASGARILTTLVHALETSDKTLGMASICIGGGEALAVIVERTSHTRA